MSSAVSLPVLSDEGSLTWSSSGSIRTSATHTASAVDPATNRRVATMQIEATLAGYRRLLRWAGRFGERRWAVENARGLGRHLAQWLVARGERRR